MSETPPMRRRGAAVVAISLLLTSCAGTSDDAPVPGPFQATATIEDLMRWVIDPAADAVWDAVVTEVTRAGTVTTVPETPGEWQTLRRHALTLTEASNLLLVEGRAVAAPDRGSEMPGVDLDPGEIAALIREDRPGWTRRVEDLRESARAVLAAVDARDAERLLEAGDRLDLACESCHARYWYPGFAGRPDAVAGP